MTQQPTLVLITGMSGAGRRTSAAALEELGWYVADNLPPELIVRMVELSFADTSSVEKLAIVTDVRSRDFAGDLHDVLTELHRVLGKLGSPERALTVLFLDAADEALITRFDTVRRSHPLQGDGTLQDGITREREMLQPVRQRADIIIDTTSTSVHDLRRLLEDYFDDSESTSPVRVNIQSFGFKHGAPKDIDVLLDARFLPNPYWVEELRSGRGTDAHVAAYVLEQPAAQAFLRSADAMIRAMLPGYRREGKSFVSVAIGCTGGHHRSVAVSAELARRLSDGGTNVKLTHRDIAR